ncbi:MAG: hypothetical protein H6512_11950 [Acidimicrobiia bacterium]|nr:hypothetical protein [Acidimicrobiia bacterium]
MSDQAEAPSEDGIDVGLVETRSKTATLLGEEVDEVEVTVSIKSTPNGETENSTETYNVVKADGDYFWTLKDDAIASYQAGECPKS